MRKAKYLFCILIAMHASSVSGQTRDELRETFFSAEGDILFEDYSEALPKYLNLLQIYPENYNYYYRIGQCYINTPGEKEKSIPFLETAVKHINTKYREGKIKETGAPADALYYLANAYRINNDLDKALESYYLFMKDINPKIYDTSLVNAQIRSCLTAREMMAKPVYLVEKNVGNILNERFSEFAPVASDDDKMFVFTRELQFYDAVFYSRQVDGKWTLPVNMTPQLGVDQDYFSSSITGDGKTLFLYRTDNYEGNIYISRFDNDSWSNVEKLNENINTKYWESHATISEDGKKLYFTSNRKGSYGGLDIFVSELDSTSNWGPAINLGPVINTSSNEESPFLANNDRTLFFSSRGHENMGGYDIFRSELDEAGEWSTPVNIGYPVNTTDDDLFFYPMGEGNKGYFPKFSSSGFGKMDIFIYEIFSDRNPRNFLVTGRASINNLLETFPEKISITAVNSSDNDKVVTTVTDPATGHFSLKLPHGNFHFTFTGDGAIVTTKDFELPLTHKGDTIKLDPVVLPNNDFIADLRIITDTMITVTSGDPVQFKLLSEPRSVLKIDLFTADSLLCSESHNMTDTVFSYTLLPREGEMKLVFNLTDRFGNMASASVNVNRARTERIAKPQYETIVAEKQVASLLDILMKYAGEDVRQVLGNINPETEKPGTCDDLIALIKNKASAAGISPAAIDKLALKVALHDGILTQAATDLLYENSEGNLQKSLSETDIYDLRIRNWNDLINRVFSVSGGKITGEDLRIVAENILMDPEPGISIIREKILYAATLVIDSAAICKAVDAADDGNYKYLTQWLNAWVSECGSKNAADVCTMIMAAISHKPGLDATELVTNLIQNSDEEPGKYFQTLNLKKLKVYTPYDLVACLDKMSDEGILDPVKYRSALGLTIIDANLTEKDIYSNMTEAEHGNRLLLIALAGIVIILLIIVATRRKRRKK